MRTSTYPALIAAFLAAFATAAAGQKGPDVAGAYQLAGQTGRVKYSGSVTFSNAVGNRFEAAWKIGTQAQWRGLCIRDDNRLSCVSCPDNGSTAKQVVAYLDGDTGLDGLTANAYDKTLGKETLTSTGRKHASIAGAYTWNVTNPNGSKLQGIASVRQQDEGPIQVYTFTFTAPSTNETAIGVSAELPGKRSDDLISVGECSSKGATAIQYSIGYTPSRALRLTGIWAQKDIAGVRSFGTETLTSGNVPPQSSVAGLNVTPDSIMGGAAATGTVTLSAAAPPGGANVVLTSNNATIVTVPANMTISAGAHIAPFTIATQHIRTSAEFVITASFGGQSRSAAITVKADTFVSDPPEAAGSFRVKLPNAVFTGTGSMCSLAGNTSAFIIQLDGPGGLGIIAATGVRLRVGTFPVAVEGDGNVRLGFTHTGEASIAYTAKSGTFSFTKLGDRASGSFRVVADVTDASNEAKEATITGAFTDIPTSC